MEQQLVSIIIPVYNAEKTIERCIDSVLNQTYKCWELIIINDGSLDSTLDIINTYKKYENIRVISLQNRGVSYARNRGINEAQGKWLTFVDADDALNPTFLEKCVALNQDFVITGYNSISYIGDVLEHRLRKVTNFNDLLDLDAIRVCWGKLYVTDLIVKNHIVFDEKMKFAEDTLFVLNYLMICKSFDAIVSSQYNYFAPNYITNTNKYSLDIDDYLLVLNKLQDSTAALEKKHHCVCRQLKENNEKACFDPFVRQLFMSNFYPYKIRKLKYRNFISYIRYYYEGGVSPKLYSIFHIIHKRRFYFIIDLFMLFNFGLMKLKSYK